MADTSTLYLLLLFYICTSQSEGQINPHEAQLPPPAQIPNLSNRDQNSHMNTKSNQSDNDSGKVGLFIAASFGIFALMIVVYCIYNRFYTKQQYQHTQLNDDPDFPSDLSNSPVFSHGSTSFSASDVKKCGYGSLSDSPSIISVPPSLSPPPYPMPFPPPFLSSHSLRTISARDLQKSCI